MVDLFAMLLRGEAPVDEVTADSVDAFNKRAYEENMTVPLGIVELNERDAYQALRHIAATASDPDLLDPHRFDWTEGTPFSEFIVANTYGHYADHIDDLRALA
jgi:hypothetical protein